MEGVVCVGSAFEEEDLPELGVLDCIMIELLVICQLWFLVETRIWALPELVTRVLGGLRETLSGRAAELVT